MTKIKGPRRPMPPRARAVIAQVTMETGIPEHEIFSDLRYADIVAARHEAIRRVFALGGIFGHYKCLGRLFGRDHSSIHYALNAKPKKANARLSLVA